MKWRQNLLSVIFVALLFQFAAGHALADDGKRVALIVGMSDYVAAGVLPNAVRDAEAFDAFLKVQGFETDLVLNANRSGLAEALARFSRKIRPDDVALFYYAGHGMQLHGDNFLVGTDAKLESEFDVPGETMALTEIVNALEKRARISLVFLDACRNNPLADRLNREVEGATRGAATRGLAPIETRGAGTLVAFAAAPGQVAADGTDGHSPFTRALIANLSGAGLEVGTAFKRVVRDVRKETDDKQQPQILSSLSLEFYFGPDGPASVPQTAVSSPTTGTKAETTEVDFRKALAINTARIWRLYLAKYPRGEYAQLAHQALTQFESLLGSTQQQAETIENRLLGTKEMRRNAQLALAANGLQIGVPDGVLGEQTRAAIRQFQTRNLEPITGFIGERTAKALGLPMTESTEGIYSAQKPRTYALANLIGLETDQRVLKAVTCLSDYEIVYGGYRGHLYVAARSNTYVFVTTAQKVANGCGAHLATIGSNEENEFVASLFNGDETFFNSGYDPGDNATFKVGPWLGLAQAPGGREPRGGWGWVTGEPLTFTKWFRDQPNEGQKNDDVGLYYAQRQGRVDVNSLPVTTWDDTGQLNSTLSFIVEFE
ncbi:MAG TPA: caspase family protein [Ensifer sp.]|jgi:hypothetical protein|uniref:caspase family protein n=1 Tax=Ensifer sp. TaxID=1872086 RepID=UPI002E0E23C7|nr:caspase family protein [Ensifer sp.]